MYIFTIPGSAFYIPSFIFFIILSFIPFYLSKNIKFLSYVFPKKIYLHPSTKMDIKILLLNTLIRPFGFLFFIFSTPWLTNFVSNTLTNLHNPTWGKWEAGNLLIFFCAFIGFILSDLAVYICHFLEHKVNPIWRVHSLHHSAEVLTPITRFRNHPLEGIYVIPITWLVFGITSGLILYITANGASYEMIMNHQMPFIFFRGILGNFYHSHMWINFNKFFSHIFISPAMHQIHHSSAPRHRNKNMGEFLAIWDYLFGTLYIPREKEDLEFGLTEKNPNPHKTLKDAYFKI